MVSHLFLVSGKTMLLPEDPTKDVIMVATGTGIAPALITITLDYF